MLPFPAVNSAVMPWDFVLILVFLGVVIPWRGAVRMKRLLSKPVLGTADRLSLYASTIVFQWLIVAIVAWRSVSRSVSLKEFGFAATDPWRVIWITIALTVLLGANQFAGLRRIARMAEGRRGSVFAITEKIMPRTLTEMCVFAGLACTAGVSEEFLYRGFVFAVFARMFVNFGIPTVAAATLSSAWFSLAHIYQGRRGMLTTFVVGVIFSLARVWSGSLVPPIAGHISVDLIAGICMFNFLRSQ